MINGYFDKAIALFAFPALWITSIEWRLRNKVGKDHFNDFKDDLKQQMNRLESHQWDLLKAQGIQPTRDIPEDIKNHAS